MASKFRVRALNIAYDNHGISGQDFAALVWPDGKMNPQGLARKGGSLLAKMIDEGLIERGPNDPYRMRVGRLTAKGERAICPMCNRATGDE